MIKQSETDERLRVALYIRVSTDEQVERFGIPLQKDALMALLASKGKFEEGGLVLAGEEYIYIDEGISGTMLLDERPAFAKLKEDILLAPEGNRPFDAVAVYKIDRFARKLKILLEIIEFFDEHEIKFISINENIDTSTPFGKAILGIIGVIAELEIETTKMRTQAGREQAVKIGIIMGSSACYGFMKDEAGRHKIFEKEAEVIRLIFRMLIIEKLSVYQIAKYLTGHNYSSPEASAIINKKRIGEIKKKNPYNYWRPERIRTILQDERYIGKYYYNKVKNGKKLPLSEWKLSPSVLPMIVDPFTFEKAQKLLNELKHTKQSAKDDHIYLLSGLLRCDGCYDPDRDKQGRARWSGDRKEIQKGGGRFAYCYKCGRKISGKSGIHCSVIPLPAKDIEDYVIEQAKELLANPIAVYNHQLKLKSTKSEIKHLKSKRESLANLINCIPERRKRLEEQHEAGFKDIVQLRTDIKGLIEKESQYKKELHDVERLISENTLSQGYIESLDLFSRKYSSVFGQISNNRKELYNLLHELIEEIIVYSRPLEEKDTVAGRRKEGQMIPYRIHIKLKLPQDILRQMVNPVGSSGQKSPSGAQGGTRTLTPLRGAEPQSAAFTNYATWALLPLINMITDKPLFFNS